MYDISVVIPAYNEEKNIKSTVEEIIEYFWLCGLNGEIIVSDDGSTDATAQIVKKMDGVKLIVSKRNTGKGGAVRRGLCEASGAAVAIMDADGAYKPCNIGYALPYLKHSDAVFGMRRTRGDYPPLRLAASRCFRRFAALAVGIKNIDFQCGFKVLSHNAAKYAAFCLKENGFAYDLELAVCLRREDYIISSIYVTVAEHGESHVKFFCDSFKMLSAVKRIKNEK